MKNNSRPTRKPTRLKGYDYSQPGRYFITICSQNREEILGIVSVGDGALDVPRKNALDVPRKSALDIPRKSALDVPRKSALDVPRKSALDIPRKSALDVPRKSALDVPRKSALDVPRKSALDVPRKSALAVPKETIQATVKLTAYGKTVEKYIESGKSVYKNMTVNNYVIMPNHIHLIIDVLESESNSTLANAAIPKFVSGLKHMVNKEIGFSAFQRSYHDHIIRNDSEYERIWNYVNSNPLCWEKDCLNGSLDLNENMMIEMMNNYIAGLGNNL